MLCFCVGPHLIAYVHKCLVYKRTARLVWIRGRIILIKKLVIDSTNDCSAMLTNPICVLLITQNAARLEFNRFVYQSHKTQSNGQTLMASSLEALGWDGMGRWRIAGIRGPPSRHSQIRHSKRGNVIELSCQRWNHRTINQIKMYAMPIPHHTAPLEQNKTLSVGRRFVLKYTNYDFIFHKMKCL